MPWRYLGFLCLKISFLSVFVPAIETAVGLPVVIWIHGGGYAYWLLHKKLCSCYWLHWWRYLAGNISQYPGQNLVTDSQNRAIAVSIQYRLGAFGSFSCILCFMSCVLKFRKASWPAAKCKHEGPWMRDCVRILLFSNGNTSYILFMDSWSKFRTPMGSKICSYNFLFHEDYFLYFHHRRSRMYGGL